MDYEVEIKKNLERNEKFLKEFENWLNEHNLSKRTIRKHLNNADLYINDYLNYYTIIRPENGITGVCSFLGDWFIEKCAWSSKNSIKETAASIKKFYQYMSEKDYIKKDHYKILCELIKENMDKFLDSMEAYENEIYYDMFDF